MTVIQENISYTYTGKTRHVSVIAANATRDGFLLQTPKLSTHILGFVGYF